MAETEQNKTEQPTPFKLKRAREKGNVARGADLGFFAALAGLTLFSLISGAHTIQTLATTMRRILVTSIGTAGDPQRAPASLSVIYAPALETVILFGGTIALVVMLFEIAQLRGLIFSAQPLKPDFNRLNPGKGLKRVFSVRMLKETLKSVLKLLAYSTAAYLTILQVFGTRGVGISDAAGLADALRAGGTQLLFVFVFLAFIFAAIDQVIVRREFLKQMRMSRSELTREVKDREGEPRIKRRRKQLHAEFASQTRGLGDLIGADMVIVNPQHYAVALSYDARTMSAPRITAKGKNSYAQLLKQRAATLSIAIYEAPPLARALYRLCEKGDEVPASEYRAVVDLYLKMAQSKAANAAANHA